MTDAPSATGLLREGLLEGHGVLLVGAEARSPVEAVADGCRALGARVTVLHAGAEARADETAMDSLVGDALTDSHDSLHVLVVDGAGMFAAGGGGGEGARPAAALRECLQGSWNATRAVATMSLLPGARGGRILFLAPARAAGEHAAAARAGLENLARTLSIEWARHRITAVAVGAGEETDERALAALVAYLASAGGAYLSGCLLEPR